MPRTVRYHDVPLFLWLIPAINVLTYYLTYPLTASWQYTLTTFVIDTLEGYIAWLILRRIILALDKKMPYDRRPIRRMVVQLVLTSLAGELAIIAATEGVNFFFGNGPVPANFYTHDIFIILVWFIVVNGIYIGLHYYQRWQEAEKRHRAELALRRQQQQFQQTGFSARSGKQVQQVPFDEIEGFYVDGEYSILTMVNGKKLLLDESLDKIEKNLPSFQFYRVNRQFILHRQMIAGFMRSEGGKLKLTLRHSAWLPASSQVSRIKARSFKEWFESNLTQPVAEKLTA